MSVTLIVEDGTNVPNSNTYISLANAVTYFQNRGDTTFVDAAPDDQAAALVRATSNMGYWLNGRWRGRRANQIQSLDWPRNYVTDSDGYRIAGNTVPQKVQFAECEVAKIELVMPFIQQSVDRYDSVQDERAGPVNVSFKPTAPSITYWPQVIAMLKDYATIGVMPIEVVIGLSESEMREMRQDHHGFGLNPFDFPDYFHLIKEPIYNPGYSYYDAPWLC